MPTRSLDTTCTGACLSSKSQNLHYRGYESEREKAPSKHRPNTNPQASYSKNLPPTPMVELRSTLPYFLIRSYACEPWRWIYSLQRPTLQALRNRSSRRFRSFHQQTHPGRFCPRIPQICRHLVRDSIRRWSFATWRELHRRWLAYLPVGHCERQGTRFRGRAQEVHRCAE